jgi:hypothetical protein
LQLLENIDIGDDDDKITLVRLLKDRFPKDLIFNELYIKKKRGQKNEKFNENVISLKNLKKLNFVKFEDELNEKG